MKQRERQARSRQEIYQAALEEFGASGYENTKMEAICTRHGISKGMMYHYYSGKDDLFLLCVGRTFEELKAGVEARIPALADKAPPEAIREFFLLREVYFQDHPQQKQIFECAMLRPPAHLQAQIRQLRAPLQQLNRRFLAQQLEKLPLRPGLHRDRAIKYLGSAEYCFRGALDTYCEQQDGADLHTLLTASGELLDMILFGIFCPSPEQDPHTSLTTDKE